MAKDRCAGGGGGRDRGEADGDERGGVRADGGGGAEARAEAGDRVSVPVSPEYAVSGAGGARGALRERDVREVPGIAAAGDSELGGVRAEGLAGRGADDRHRGALHRD